MVPVFNKKPAGSGGMNFSQRGPHKPPRMCPPPKLFSGKVPKPLKAPTPGPTPGKAPFAKLEMPFTLPEQPRLREPSYRFSVYKRDDDDRAPSFSNLSRSKREHTFVELTVIKEDKGEVMSPPKNEPPLSMAEMLQKVQLKPKGIRSN